ncbi:hypothetical protein [Streptomyces sp. NPDC058548]|uniref:hypothetical protein n=1 Tax=unclassified Streptomyces TaxID=2593676 RepID=UPI003654B931
MTLVPPVPTAVTVASDSAAVDGAVVDSAAPDSVAADSTVADRPETGAREAAPVPSGLPVPPPRPADTEQGQEPEPEPEAASEPEPVSVPAPEPVPEPLNPIPGRIPGSTPGPRLRHVRIDPPAGARGETDDPSPRVPRTPPRFGVVAVPQPSRTTSDRRNGTPSVRPVRLTDTTAAPVGLPGATERPAAVTPVPLPVPRLATPVTPAGPDAPARPDTPVTPAVPAGPATPTVPPSTESRTEEPQP